LELAAHVCATACPHLRAPGAPRPGSTERNRSDRAGKRSTNATMPDNAYIEAFNGRLRAECLNAHWFLTLADTAEKLEGWRRDYNEQRPHSAIGNNVPAALMKSTHAASP
ncbi:MAG: transposase, partial [Gammaproteobacteria bacterium]